MNKLLDELNQNQKNAVLFNGRFLEIMAGPGTGKSTTLAAKILYVQSELGVDVDNILGISFSRSAKSQLLDKLEEFTDLIGYGGKPAILTFHSFAHRILKYGIYFKESHFRPDIKLISTEDFIKCDPSLTRNLCKEYANRVGVNEALSSVYNQVRQGSPLVNRPFLHYNEVYDDSVYSVTTYEYGRINVHGNDLKTYWSRLRKIEKTKNVTDYQGLITEAIRLLQLKQQTYMEITDKYTHLFIDEYQDTSLAQEELLLSLIKDIQHITVVGDKNQTIYTFNGSNIQNMQRFENLFSNQLPSEFAKIELIHNYHSTNEIITLANDFIKDSKIIPYNARTGFKPTVVETHSIDLAVRYIVEKISDITKNDRYKLSDICILYRKNSIHSPQGRKIFDALEGAGISYTSNHTDLTKNTSLISKIIDLSVVYEDELLKELVLKLKEKDEDDELISFVKDAIKQGAIDTDDLIDYIVDFSESIEEQQNDEVAVVARTVHDAKGLEYPIVFILYLGDRQFPHSSQPNIDEESRLFFVGMTRAQDQLYILGERGILQPSFMDQCLHSNVRHEQYHTSKEKVRAKKQFSDRDKRLIDKTSEQQANEERKQKEELRKLMDFL